MKKNITIICDKDVPVKHLLNDQGWDIYEATGNEEIFTMVEREKSHKKT